MMQRIAACATLATLSCFVAPCSAKDPVTPACEGETCTSTQKNESILLQQWHNSSMHLEVGGPTSCVDGKTPRTTNIPDEYNPWIGRETVDEECAFNVKWEPSAWMQDLLTKYKKPLDQYQFRVCWDKNSDPEKREFPWVHATAEGDFRYPMMKKGHVMMNTMDTDKKWRDGYQQVLPDALEFFAKKGEAAGRKIKPKFLLYGWSKGCTFNFPLARWRPDVVQGVVCLHGCNGKQLLGKEMIKKANNEAAAPILWLKSWKDGFLNCAAPDTEKAYAFTKKESKQATVMKDDPCGHYPTQCMPLCDPMEFMVGPFWQFYEDATTWKQCQEPTDQKTCEGDLCVWDEETSKCFPEYPSWFTEQCQSFCSLSKVDACDGLDEGSCSSSYSEVDGKHYKCKFSGSCSAAPVGVQCLFQDQC